MLHRVETACVCAAASIAPLDHNLLFVNAGNEKFIIFVGYTAGRHSVALFSFFLFYYCHSFFLAAAGDKTK